MDFLLAHLDNQFTAGAVTAVLLGAFLALLRHVPQHIAQLAARWLVVRVDVADHDPAFFWLQSWLAAHPYTRRARVITATTRTAPGEAPSSKVDASAALQMSPAPGWHLLWHAGKPLLLRRTRKESEGTLGALAYRETFTLVALRRCDAVGVVHAARLAADPMADGSIAVYRRTGWQWTPVQRVAARSLGSVVLPAGVAEGLLEDVRRWQGAAARYRALGVPWRRGYLLSGPPGTGKTSLAMALAGELGLDVYALNLAGLGDGSLANAMDEAPTRALLLCEDVDCAFSGREPSVKSDREPLTFSGLINAIDGAVAKEGRLLVMTTNHPERLDPALLRPGRADVHLRLDVATFEQARSLYLRFHPGRYADAALFAKTAAGQSPAALQEQLMSEDDQPKRSVHAASWNYL